jgi:hypothetical protein
MNATMISVRFIFKITSKRISASSNLHNIILVKQRFVKTFKSSIHDFKSHIYYGINPSLNFCLADVEISLIKKGLN